MAVRVPISADPAGTVAAFNEITNAIRRAGQEGRKFSDLDFSHPELKKFESDLRGAQRNFDELKKVGRGQTAAAVRAGKYTDVLDWYKRHGRQFPDATARQKHTATVGSYVSQGTRFEPPEPSSGGGRGGGRGLGGLPIPGVGRMLKGALALAGVGGLAAMAKQGIGQAQDEAVAIDDLLRSINDTRSGFDGLRDAVENSTRGMGLNYKESVKLAQGYARASALQQGASIAQGVHQSTGFARSFGMDPQQAGGFFGAMRFRGITGPGGMDPKQFALMMADAIASGGMFAKSNEVMQAVAHYVQSSERVMVTAPNVAGFADWQSRMNWAGDHGQPGLRGEMGAALIGQVDAAIRSGGRNGPAGQNILWRALNHGGEQLNPALTKWLEAGGAMGTRANAFKTIAPELAHGDQTNLDLIIDEFRRRFKGRGKAWRAEGLSETLGIGIRQAQALFRLQNQQGGGLGGILNTLKGTDLTYKDISATGLHDLGKIANASASQIKDIKARFLSRDDLSAEQKQAITAAKTPDSQREALIKAAAAAGRQQTEGSATRNAIADLYNALTDTGKPLVSGVNAIKETAAKILSSIALAESPTTEGARYRDRIGRSMVGAAEDVGNAVFDQIPGHEFIGDILKLKNPFRHHSVDKVTYPPTPKDPSVIPAPPPKVHVTTEVVHKDTNGKELGRETDTHTVRMTPEMNSG